MIKKLILLTTVLLPYSIFASSTPLKINVSETKADNPLEIKLEGLFNFQAGFKKQSNLDFNENFLSPNNKRTAFFSEANLGATFLTNVEDIIYGAKIVLKTTAKTAGSASLNGSHLFVESGYGRVELGSPQDAGSKMRVCGEDVAKGPGGNWTRYIATPKNITNDESTNLQHLGTEHHYYFDNVFISSSNPESMRTVSFYTPKHNGLQLGISYIPESNNLGFTSDLTSDDASIKFDSINTKVSFKNGFSGGVTYEHNLSDDMDLKLGLSGEYAKTISKPININLAFKKFSNIKTMNIGANLSYGNFAYGLSYGNKFKSITTRDFPVFGRDTQYYNASVAYTQGPLGVSLTYFKSNNYKNNVDAWTLGTDCKILPYLIPYAEVSYITLKGRALMSSKATPKKVSRATIALIGAKLKI